MKVEDAISAANRLRPNNGFEDVDKYRWLQECDALARAQVIRKSLTGDFEGVGADQAGEDLGETTELLVPSPYDALYPHYLTAQIDAALGEFDRAANELAQYNALLTQFSVWMRQTYPPAKRPKFLY